MNNLPYSSNTVNELPSPTDVSTVTVFPRDTDIAPTGADLPFPPSIERGEERKACLDEVRRAAGQPLQEECQAELGARLAAAGEANRLYYLDLYASNDNGGEVEKYEGFGGEYSECGTLFKTGYCEGKERHEVVKILGCCKEWCLICRETITDRRVARASEKYECFGGIGYFVFTLPEEVKEKLKEKGVELCEEWSEKQEKKRENLLAKIEGLEARLQGAKGEKREKLQQYVVKLKCQLNRKPKPLVLALNTIRNYIRRKFERVFGQDVRAIVRWHWFGDCKECEKLTRCGKCDQCKKGKRCEKGICPVKHEGVCGYDKFHPHLNILVDSLQYLKGCKKAEGTYLQCSNEDHLLCQIKQDYKAWLESTFKVELSAIDINYRYIKLGGEGYQGKKWHRLRYVMRPTFLKLDGNGGLARELKGYLNSSFWGSWSDGDLQMARKSLAARTKTRKLGEVALLAKRICPKCGSRIDWGRHVDKVSDGLPKGKKAVAVGGGYFHLENSS